MSSSFITRIEREKHEPYAVIFTTDDHDKYRHIEDECRKMIGHAKPTVDAVPVVRCKDCKACMFATMFWINKLNMRSWRKRRMTTHESIHL